MRARILYTTTTSDVGGAEVFLEELVGRLDRARFEPRVVSFCDVGRAGQRLADQGIRVDSLGLGERSGPADLVRGVARLRRVLRRDRIDLVHSQLYRANVVSNVAARLVRPRPVVVNAQHSLYAMTGKSAEIIARVARPLADLTVAVTPVVHTYLVETDGVPAEKIRVIDNGVDEQRFRPGDEPQLRAELGVLSGELLLGAVGRLSEEKGLDVLLRVLSREALPPVRLAIVGDGPERSALEELTRSLGLEDRVAFLGMRSDTERLLRAFDLFVLPSLKEALPIALLEAMASGCAILASRVGGIPGALAPEVEGVLVDPRDEDQLAQGLQRLVGSAELRSKLGRAARLRVEQSFTLDGTARRHEELYTELLSGRGCASTAP